jgi:hypothetical protein
VIPGRKYVAFGWAAGRQRGRRPGHECGPADYSTTARIGVTDALGTGPASGARLDSRAH